MQILLACAKTMNDSCRETSLPLSAPRFLSEAEAFVRDLWQYDAPTIASMLGCSEAIARENLMRFSRFFDPDNLAMPAVMAYHGQAYKHLRAETLPDEALAWAQEHLWITSFLYGLLRPLDGIHPYRLEGDVTMPSGEGQNQFSFWKPRLTDLLIASVKADDGILVHLATEEFQHLFDWKRVCREVHVIQPLFYVRDRNGRLKMQAVWAKTCRGAMTRYIVENRVCVPELLQGFSYEGFSYSPYAGEPDFPHFIRQ